MDIAGGLVTLPPVPHWPGRTPRPDEAVFAPLRQAASVATLPADHAESPAFLAGFEAFQAGYFWEAHEIWEPVWMALPPASRERHLVQGLIQLANAALKRAMGKAAASGRILVIADRELEAAFAGYAGRLMGIDRSYIATLRLRVTAN